MPQAKTIDEVIQALTGIIEDSLERESRIGYFAALYRKVTVNIRDKIAEGHFDDGARMERLDVIFANRYLDAVQARRLNAPCSEVWTFAFDVAEHRSPIVLQHLLLGMNAHINLDLGIAAAEAVAPEALPQLRGDFNRINGVLAGLVNEVRAELAEIWTTLRLFNRYLGPVQTEIINFSMEQARDQAWSVAERLSPLSGDARSDAIREIDREFMAFGQLIRYPGPKLRIATALVRIGERGSVRRKIEILE